MTQRRGVHADDVIFGAARKGTDTDSSDRRRLQGITFTAVPGDLVAIVGPSGSGKSTLLEVLAGLLRTDAGDGEVAGVALGASVAARSGRVAYVPQAESLPTELSVGVQFRFASELRRPKAAPHEQIADWAINAMGLDQATGRPLARLSGGERRRVSVAQELVGQAEVLLVDEPSTGLDPHHEAQIMVQLRGLASSGRTVLVATHSIAALTLFDRVLVLAPGGKQVYFGAVDGALRTLGADTWLDVYRRLVDDGVIGLPIAAGSAESESPSESQSQLEIQPKIQVLAGSSEPTHVTRRNRTTVLIRRECARLRAERRMSALLLGQALVFGLLIRVMNRQAMTVGAVTTNLSARRVLLTLVLSAVWMGSISSVRQLVRDRPIIQRERLAGVRLRDVMLSKLVLLAGVTGIQCSVMVLAAIPAKGADFGWLLLRLVVDVWFAGFAAGCVALAVSGLCRTTDRALILMSLVLVPQLVLSGGVMSLESMGPVRPLSYLSVARWGLSAAASTTDLRRLETATLVNVPLTLEEASARRHEDNDPGWKPSPIVWLVDLSALGLLALASTALAGLGCRRVW